MFVPVGVEELSRMFSFLIDKLGGLMRGTSFEGFSDIASVLIRVVSGSS